MKTISDYSISSTEEQTRHALELGVLINKNYLDTWVAEQDDTRTMIDNVVYSNPTAEELIGWLEEQFFNEIRVQQGCKGWWGYTIYGGEYDDVISEKLPSFPTRKEATIAAIDAALDYLIDNKK